jgi:serine/threonine protein kinase
MVACGRCGGRTEPGRFCASCGTEQPRADSARGDDLVGQLLAGRYEIVELIDSGGGGRVYRAVQKPLERSVAIKIVHPSLLGSAEAVTRFAEEARALSLVNHPNVVSVHDFGWSSGDQTHLFLVMEYVAGPSLSTLLAAGEPLALRRAAGIIGQTLAALGEAHHLDITHRDMKPENIMLQPTRTGTDHVKVIDFGIAQLARGKRLTEFGGSLGTPEYMAPEQVRGEEVGPSADLYSVGVILFQMLTGRLPFQGGSPVETMVRQLAAPRPDPVVLASTSKVSRELAAVCIQALNVDPAERFADAAAFAEALEQALPPEAKGTRGLFSARSRNSIPAPPLPPAAAPADARKISRARLRTPVVEVEEPRALAQTSSEFEGDSWPFDFPMVGRSAELDWALEQLVQDTAGVAFCGRAGVGKTRLLREVCAALAKLDLGAFAIAVDPMPLCEAGYSTLKRMIAALSGHTSMALATAAGVSNARVANALRTLFASGSEGVRGTDASPATALEWAARAAAERSGGKGVVLAIDDADRADGASITVLAELLRARSVPGFSVLMTNERLPDAAIASGVALRGLRGLGVKAATALLTSKNFTGVVPRSDDIEPLYVEGLLRWHARDALPPAESLRELIERRVRSMSVPERKVLLAIAALGRTSREELEAVQGEAVAGNAIKKLCESGLVLRHGNALEPAHAVYGRIVLGLAPAEALAELHVRAADRLMEGGGALEVQAFHAVQGCPDVEAFLLVDEAARVRKLRKDHDGAAAILRLGLEAARARLVRGDRDAVKPLAVFGRKLGGALLDASRLDEAHAALSEALALANLPELERALVLEQLAAVENTRGRAAESDRLRNECLEAAERCGDTGLIARVTNPARPARREPVHSSASPFSALRRLSNPSIRGPS